MELQTIVNNPEDFDTLKTNILTDNHLQIIGVKSQLESARSFHYKIHTEKLTEFVCVKVHSSTVC